MEPRLLCGDLGAERLGGRRGERRRGRYQIRIQGGCRNAGQLVPGYGWCACDYYSQPGLQHQGSTSRDDVQRQSPTHPLSAVLVGNFSATGAEAAARSNICLGWEPPGCVLSYMVESGATNASVGHRRWMLLPQTLTMGTGDVPQAATHRRPTRRQTLSGCWTPAFPPRVHPLATASSPGRRPATCHTRW